MAAFAESFEPVDVSSSAATPMTPSRLGGRLPRQLTSFVGRQPALIKLIAMVQATPLITLTGAGGAGKTRLAVEIGAAVRQRFADGVWFVDLAAVADPTRLPDAVASALGLIELANREIDHRIFDYLAAKQALVILDNCEHLIDACAYLVAELLQRCPNLRVMATSRERLNIAGETTWRVDSLSVPSFDALELDPGANPAALTRFEAVQLFVERAQQIQRSFGVTPDNGLAVARICQRLDGLPLAIELAAARVNAMTVDQIATRLDNRFRLLVGGSRTALPRQQTLRALVEWSHDLLDPEERVLFRRLSVFAGGWTLDAAESTLGDDCIDVLPRLVDKSLVVAEEQDGVERYQFLETIRQFAEGKLAALDNAPQWRQSHLEWCQRLADTAAAHFFGPLETQWCRRLETERHNLRAAIAWSRRQTDGAEPALRLAGTLMRFWDMLGHFREGFQLLGELLAETSVIAHYRVNAAMQYANLGYQLRALDHERRIELWQSTLAMSRQLGYPFGIVASMTRLGSEYAQLGERSRAELLQDEALAIARESGHEFSVRYALIFRSDTARQFGDVVVAELLLTECLDRNRAVGNHWAISLVASSLARLALGSGDSTRAHQLCHEALSATRGNLDARSVPTGIEVMAWTLAEAGESARAAKLLGAAEAARNRVGTPLHAEDAAQHQRAIDLIKERLPIETMTRELAVGRGMSLAEAVEDALNLIETPLAERRVSPASVASDPYAPLTPREVEVARLIVNGHTNTQIAQALVISPKTAINHVQNILDKLALRTRAEVARWVVERSQG